jgi:hypothetical protein
VGIDANGEWDGVCACGKKEADGVRCKYGATHQKPKPMPWETQEKPKEEFPW